MAPRTINVIGFDHLVLNCADVETTLRWYVDELGLAPVRVDEWRQGSAPFPSVRVNDTTIIDLIAGDTSSGRLDHICLVVSPTDLDELKASGRFTVLEGPAARFGAQGIGTSLYISDPDGTMIELRHYGG